MPPFTRSRHAFTEAVKDSQGRLRLTDREPFRYADNLPGTVAHRVVLGDTLWSLADKHYHPLPDASQLWWILADFQPEPILDPTVALTPGSILFIPSLAVVQSRVFSETRRDET